MATEATENTNTTESDHSENYVVNYYISIYFQENCGVDNVVINQTGKPKEDDPPPGTGGGN